MGNSVFERILESRLAKGAALGAALSMPLSAQAAGLADMAAKIWSRTTVYGFTQNGELLNPYQQNEVNGLAVVVKAPGSATGQGNALQSMARNIHNVSEILGSGYVVSDISAFTGNRDNLMNAKDKGATWVAPAIAATLVVGGVAALVSNGNHVAGSRSNRDPNPNDSSD